MFRRSVSLAVMGLLLLGLVLVAAPWLPGQPPAPAASGVAEATSPEAYLRLTRDGSAAKALEAAIVRFTPRGGTKKSPTVDLVSAVHVAEGSYYKRLNKEFGQYDVVLYELVAPEGTRPPREAQRTGGSMVTGLQTGLTGLLNLEFQLDAIDYRRDNMVHADLSPEEFHRSMKDRGESMATIFARAMGYAIAKQASDPSGGDDMKLLLALLDKDRAGALKRVMAEQMVDLGGMLEVLEGKDGSTLIADRNARVMEVLRREIAAGKKKIAIFYGAGHMPDLAGRLQKDLGLVPGGTRWLVAWDLTDSRPQRKPAAPSSSPVPQPPALAQPPAGQAAQSAPSQQ